MVKIGAPDSPVKGEIHLPSSKSLSNRLLILNYLSGSNATLRHLSTAEDTRLLEAALQNIKKGEQHIDVGHAGTDFRFLTALLAFTKGTFTLTGSDRLQQRPIKGLVDSLRQLDAGISYLGKEGYPPLRIDGETKGGGSVTVDASTSSQFISALMLAFPLLKGDLIINLTGKTVSAPYIDMTIGVLKLYGIRVNKTGHSYMLSGSLKKPAGDFEIEADWSAASYYYSVCALSKESRIVLHRLTENSSQGDSVLAGIYRSLGVKTTFLKNSITLEHTHSENEPFVYDFSDCPDLAQTVALTCAAQNRTAHLTGLETLRIKETDRIKALETELSRLGITTESTGSTLSIAGGSLSNPPVHPVKTYNDHRMAMSFAPLALVMQTLSIEDPGVVIKSYPHFWDDLRSLGFSVNLQPQ